MGNKSKKSSIKRIFNLIIIVLLALIVSGIVFISFSYKPFLKEKIAKTVYERTDKTYWFSTNDITINLFKRYIKIEHLMLEPAPGLKSDSTMRLFNASVKTLSMSEIRIIPLLFHNKLIASKFIIDKPVIEMNTNEELNLELISTKKISKGDSLHIPFLNEILIDSIVISNVQLNIDTLFRTSERMPGSKLVLTKFRTGGIKQTDSPFPFDVNDLTINIEGLAENLPDKIHRIYAREISLSLLYSKLTVSDFTLKPIEGVQSTLDNQYSVFVPFLEIESDNFEEIMQTDSLIIKSVRMEEPAIEIKFGGRIEKGTPLNEINLYPLIQDKFRNVAVNHFAIQNADLKMIPPNSEVATQHIENLFVKFFEFNLDSASNKHPDLILSARDLNISLERFTLNHNDNIHCLVIQKLRADTRDQRITTGDVSFKPIKPLGSSYDNTNIDIHCQAIQFKEVNFKDFYHRQILPMDELVIKAPEANIYLLEKKIVKKQKRDFSLILNKTNDYIKGIYVKKAKIEQGYINYSYLSLDKKTGFFRTNFQFELDNLSLDNATFYKSDKIFFADQFKAWFSGLGLQLADDFHRLLADSVFISSRNRSAEILDFRISPIKTSSFANATGPAGQTGIYDIHFPTIRLIGADLHKAFFKKELYISNIDIKSPYLNIETKQSGKKSTSPTGNINNTEIYNLISEYLYKINIWSMSMTDGSLNLTQYRIGENPIEFNNFFDITMTGFELDSISGKRTNKLLFSDEIDLILKNQSFTMADGVHRLSSKEIAILTSSDKIYLRDARLYPDVLSPSFKNLPVAFTCNIPSVEFTGADINGLINNGNFFAKNVTFTNPDIQVMVQTLSDSIKGNNKQNALLVKGLKTFWANTIVFDKGFIDVANYLDGKNKTFASSYFDVKIDNFKADLGSNNPAIKYTNLNVTLENASYNLPDKIHQLSVGNANYNLGKQLFSFSDIDIRPDRGISPDKPISYLNLYFPKGSITGFDIRKLFDEKKFTAFTLTLENPDIQIKDKTTKKTGKFDPYRLNLYAMLQPQIEMVYIGQILFQKGNLRYEQKKPIEISNFSITANNFLVNKYSDQKDKLLNCDGISFEIDYFTDKTSDGFYYYGFDKLSLNDKGDLKISGISLTPAYPEAEFCRKKKYQDDCITINRADCTGKGFNLKRLINDNELFIPEMRFEIDQTEIFRNSQYPFAENFEIEMPQKLLRDMEFRFGVDFISLECRKFFYRELEPQATSETKVHFTDVKASLTNVTNINSKLQKNPVAKLDIDAKLMGFGPMSATMNMNIADKRNLFNMKAECGKIPFHMLNSVTEPSLSILLKDGYNSKMEIYFEANNDSATGWMKFAYNDLMISVLTEQQGKMKEERFISFLANALAVKRDNPIPGRLIEPVYITAYPDRRKSIVNYCWLAAFEGIKKTLGMKETTNNK
ncbi:MAG: hypothetical protein JW798_07845 [Prolixibacteraceae bacterium]|nr:hypothetical protein [Prolixibacteraceae bacterium]